MDGNAEHWMSIVLFAFDVLVMRAKIQLYLRYVLAAVLLNISLAEVLYSPFPRAYADDSLYSMTVLFTTFSWAACSPIAISRVQVLRFEISAQRRGVERAKMQPSNQNIQANSQFFLLLTMVLLLRTILSLGTKKCA